MVGAPEVLVLLSIFLVLVLLIQLLLVLLELLLLMELEFGCSGLLLEIGVISLLLLLFLLL